MRLKRNRDKKGRFAKGRRVTIICKTCGKPFDVTPSRAGRKYCSVECRNIAYRGRPSHGRKFAKGHQPWNKGLKGIHLSPSTEFKPGNVPWWKKRGLPNVSLLPEVKIKKSESQKKNWKDPEYVRKMMRVHKVRPNKAEIKLEKLMRDHGLPFRYVGDGKVIIAGKCPDYINTNGKKQVIELFATRWHNPKEEDERKETFAKYGYRTLIVWYSEFKKNPNKVLERISSFERGLL